MFLHPELLTQQMVDARNGVNKEAEIFFAMTTNFLQEWVNEPILKVDGSFRKKFKDQLDSLISTKIGSAAIPLGIFVTPGHASISVELNTQCEVPSHRGVEYFKAAFIPGFHRNGILESVNSECAFRSDFTKEEILALLKEKDQLKDRLSTVESTLTRFAGF